MNTETDVRSSNFWSMPETFTQRMTTKQWKNLLMDRMDTFIAQGRLWQLVAKSLGAGVYEVRARLYTEVK